MRKAGDGDIPPVSSNVSGEVDALLESVVREIDDAKLLPLVETIVRLVRNDRVRRVLTTWGKEDRGATMMALRGLTAAERDELARAMLEFAARQLTIGGTIAALAKLKFQIEGRC